MHFEPEDPAEFFFLLLIINKGPFFPSFVKSTPY